MGLCLPLAGVDAGVVIADADEALEPVMRSEHTSALGSVSASMSMPETGCWLSQGDKWCNVVLPLHTEVYVPVSEVLFLKPITPTEA